MDFSSVPDLMLTIAKGWWNNIFNLTTMSGFVDSIFCIHSHWRIKFGKFLRMSSSPTSFQSRAVTDYSWHCSVVMKISMAFLKLSAVCYRFLFSPYCSTLTLCLPFLAVVFMGSCSEPDQEVKQAENWWLSPWIHFFSPAAHIPKNILDVAICLVVKQDWQKQTNSHNRGLWMLLEYRYLFIWYGRVGTYGTKVVPKKVIHYGTNL